MVAQELSDQTDGAVLAQVRVDVMEALDIAARDTKQATELSGQNTQRALELAETNTAST